MKMISIVLALLAVPAVWAGFIAGDDTGFPRVNVDAHLYRIVRTYYPDTSMALDKGLKRNQAWSQDIRQAAKGLDIPQARLDAFIQAVIDPKLALVTAPHPKLVEFELYAAGLRKLGSPQYYVMPPEWRRLLALPEQDRHYTSIPVLYVDYCRNSFSTLPVAFDTPRDEVLRLYHVAYQLNYRRLKEITALRQAGFADTQGCERVMIFDLGTENLLVNQWMYCFKMIRLGVELSDRPPRTGREAGDWIFSGAKMHPLVYLLCTADPETLRNDMEHDAALRDLVVALGLSRQLPVVSDLALEFSPGSAVNRPLLALKEEDSEVLNSYPEYRRLQENMEILNSEPQDVPRLVDEYLAKYPEQTCDDLKTDSVIYSSGGELQGLAGASLIKNGDAQGALRRFLKGGTPEDIALIAEQILPIDELKALVDEETAGMAKNIVFSHAPRPRLLVLTPEEASVLVRSLLARRLMREGRENEATMYFPAGEVNTLYRRYMFLQTQITDRTVNSEIRAAALLELAALLRIHGTELLGTELAPDYLLYGGQIPVTEGGDTGSIIPQRPDLPGCHCQLAAAALYRRAAALSTDPEIQSFAFWAAGNLTDGQSPGAAAADFSALAKLPTALGRAAQVRRWLPPESELRSQFPTQFRRWQSEQFMP